MSLLLSRYSAFPRYQTFTSGYLGGFAAADLARPVAYDASDSGTHIPTAEQGNCGGNISGEGQAQPINEHVSATYESWQSPENIDYNTLDDLGVKALQNVKFQTSANKEFNFPLLTLGYQGRNYTLESPTNVLAKQYGWAGYPWLWNNGMYGNFFFHGEYYSETGKLNASQGWVALKVFPLFWTTDENYSVFKVTLYDYVAFDDTEPMAEWDCPKDLDSEYSSWSPIDWGSSYLHYGVRLFFKIPEVRFKQYRDNINNRGVGNRFIEPWVKVEVDPNWGFGAGSGSAGKFIGANQSYAVGPGNENETPDPISCAGAVSEEASTNAVVSLLPSPGSGVVMPGLEDPIDEVEYPNDPIHYGLWPGYSSGSGAFGTHKVVKLKPDQSSNYQSDFLVNIGKPRMPPIRQTWLQSMTANQVHEAYSFVSPIAADNVYKLTFNTYMDAFYKSSNDGWQGGSGINSGDTWGNKYQTVKIYANNVVILEKTRDVNNDPPSGWERTNFGSSGGMGGVSLYQNVLTVPTANLGNWTQLQQSKVEVEFIIGGWNIDSVSWAGPFHQMFFNKTTNPSSNMVDSPMYISSMSWETGPCTNIGFGITSRDSDIEDGGYFESFDGKTLGGIEGSGLVNNYRDPDGPTNWQVRKPPIILRPTMDAREGQSGWPGTGTGDWGPPDYLPLTSNAWGPKDSSESLEIYNDKGVKSLLAAYHNQETGGAALDNDCLVIMNAFRTNTGTTNIYSSSEEILEEREWKLVVGVTDEAGYPPTCLQPATDPATNAQIDSYMFSLRKIRRTPTNIDVNIGDSASTICTWYWKAGDSTDGTVEYTLTADQKNALINHLEGTVTSEVSDPENYYREVCLFIRALPDGWVTSDYEGFSSAKASANIVSSRSQWGGVYKVGAFSNHQLQTSTINQNYIIMGRSAICQTNFGPPVLSRHSYLNKTNYGPLDGDDSYGEVVQPAYSFWSDDSSANRKKVSVWVRGTQGNLPVALKYHVRNSNDDYIAVRSNIIINSDSNNLDTPCWVSVDISESDWADCETPDEQGSLHLWIKNMNDDDYPTSGSANNYWIEIGKCVIEMSPTVIAHVDFNNTYIEANDLIVTD